MYIPPHFEQTDPHRIAALIRDFPLACIVGQTAQGLVANHLPLLLLPQGALIGHLAVNNDMHRLIADGQEVLAIFRAEDAYVSPNLYPTKAEHHRHVPTWNYEVVHVHGTIHFQRDEKARRAAVGRLTKTQETRANGDTAWKMSDAPEDYMAQMMQNIIALRIDVTQVLAKSKLSQNRDAVDHASVAEAMEAQGHPHLAAAMRRVR